MNLQVLLTWLIRRIARAIGSRSATNAFGSSTKETISSPSPSEHLIPRSPKNNNNNNNNINNNNNSNSNSQGGGVRGKGGGVEGDARHSNRQPSARTCPFVPWLETVTVPEESKL